MAFRGLILASVVLLTSSCDRFQPDSGVLEYGAQLPDYCLSSAHALELLERDAQGYGKALVEKGVFGEWDGLLHSLILQHFLWGDYEAAVRVGNKYAEIRDVLTVPEYVIANYLSQEDVESSPIKESPYYVSLQSGVGELANLVTAQFKAVDDIFAFRTWSSDPQGLNALLVLSIRLNTEQLEEEEQRLAVSSLLPLFTEGQPLDRFMHFANEGAPWAWTASLKSSLMLEESLQEQGADSLLIRIRAARKSIAEKMSGTKYEQDWMDFVLQDQGIFNRED